MPIEYRQFRKNHADRDAKPWLGIEIENPHTCQKIKCEVSFVKGLKIPLLGVKSFLSNFILTIDYPREIFSLKLPIK